MSLHTEVTGNRVLHKLFTNSKICLWTHPLAYTREPEDGMWLMEHNFSPM